MNQPTENIKTTFALLFHQFDAGHNRDDHWDLMLEQDGVLLTWALEELPAPGKLIPAIRLDDHRITYLEYEGPIAGDRGSVSRVLSGSYTWKRGCEEQIAVLDFPENRWEVEFRKEIGSKARGQGRKSEVGSGKFLIEVRFAEVAR